jgi:hypothetical protein
VAYTDLASLRAYGAVASTVDDSILLDVIERASRDIDGFCGQSFEQAVVTGEVTTLVWVDPAGWLYVGSKNRCPVTGVDALELLDREEPNPTWRPVDLSQAVILIPEATVPPRQDAWLVRLKVPGFPGRPRPRGRLWARWSYRAGYPVVPGALRAVATRYAWWLYKLREAPLGRVVTAELGLMEIPLTIPKDVAGDLQPWVRLPV